MSGPYGRPLLLLGAEKRREVGSFAPPLKQVGLSWKGRVARWVPRLWWSRKVTHLDLRARSGPAVLGAFWPQNQALLEITVV